MHKYEAFGKVIFSELPLPDLRVTCANEADITIKYGSVGDFSTRNRYPNKSWLVSNESVQVIIPDLFGVAVDSDGGITIEQGEEISDRLVQLLIYNNVIGLALYWLGNCVLSGSAVTLPGGKSIIFLGNPVEDRTALCLLLSQRGSRVLTDGICAVTVDNTNTTIFRGYPFIQVWLRTLNKLNLDPCFYCQFRPELEKYKVKIADPQTSVALDSLFVLEKTSASMPVQKTELSGRDSAIKILSHSYRSKFLEGMGLTKHQFMNVSSIANTSRIHLLRYWSAIDQFDEIEQAILHSC